MKKGMSFLLSAMFAMLSAGWAQGDPLQKKPVPREDARRAPAAAVAESRKNNWNMAVAVFDDGGTTELSVYSVVNTIHSLG